MTDQIIGAGGGQSSAGGSQKAEKDNLDSRQVARIVDLLSEGEIEGFATPSRLGIARSRTTGQDPTRYERELLKDIFLNNTPMVRTGADVSTALQESDKNFQFNYNDKERAVSPRYGEGDDQDPLDEVSQTIQEEVAVGV